MRKSRPDNGPVLVLQAVQRAEAWAQATNKDMVVIRQEMLATRIEMANVAKRLRGATLWLVLILISLSSHVLAHILAGL